MTDNPATILMPWNRTILAAAASVLLRMSPYLRAQLPATQPSAPPELQFPKIPPSEADEMRQREASAQHDKAELSPGPATAPVTPPPPIASNGMLILPASYYAVTSRSIFIKGAQDVFDRYSRGSHSTDPQNAHPVNWSSTQPSISRPESTLIFDGATQADGRFVALIEDSGSHAVTKVSPGDHVARGTITSLTLDQLDYTSAGRTVHVGLGQNLDGEGASLSSAGTGTAAPGASLPAGGGGPDDVLEKLRRRRQQELTGK